MKKYISLKDKLILNFVLIGISIILVISFFAYYTAKNILIDRTFEQLTTLRVIKKRQLEGFFKDRKNDIELLASSEGIYKIMEILKNKNLKDTSDIEQMTVTIQKSSNLDQLLFYLRSKGYYKNLYIINPGGISLKTSLDQGNQRFLSFKSGTFGNLCSSIIQNNIPYQSAVIKDLDSTNSGHAFLSVCKLAGYEKGSNGVIVLEIPASALNSIMLEDNPYSGLGESGESYLVGKDHLMRSNSRFQNSSILRTKVETQAVKKALDGDSGTLITPDYRGIKVLSSFAPVVTEEINWALLAEIDLEEALTPLSAITNNIIIVGTFIALILFIYTYIISHTVTSPVIKLKNAAQKIGQGNFDINLPGDSYDEIGDLRVSFNDMSARLKDITEKLKEERTRRLRSVFDGQEIERQRLSRELHDGLGQNLIALKLMLENIRGHDLCDVFESIREVKKSIDTTIDEIRRMSNNLMPAVLFEFGLITAIRKLSEEIKNNCHIKVDLETSLEEESLSKTNRTYLYRIVQEALNNSLKHSEASLIKIKINQDQENFRTTISDNGKGFNMEDNQAFSGNGLSNMKDRAGMMGGTLKINSEAGMGTTIVVEIPYAKQRK
ncbi:MAG: HAMP domain-containing protein [Bacteroidetes bacterium]|nr:HAMP domain-containing protein [Bacteroidota bacterium]